MLSKCANPGCPATFLYLHQGKLFRLDPSIELLVRIPVREVTRPSCRFEFFWLCDECAAELTLGYNIRNRNHGCAPAKGTGTCPDRLGAGALTCP